MPRSGAAPSASRRVRLGSSAYSWSDCAGDRRIGCLQEATARGNTGLFAAITYLYTSVSCHTIAESRSSATTYGHAMRESGNIAASRDQERFDRQWIHI
jgi:hypothetical protein